MKYRKWICMLCAIFLLSACAAKEPVKEAKKKVVSIPQPTLNTEDVSAVVMDADTGKVYYAKNEQESRYPASTIKLLSALVAIDYYKDNDELTTRNIMSLPDRVFIHTAPVYDGERIPFKDVIHGMLLKSSNEMALTLAENYKGGYDGFIEAMNKRAKKIGCTKVDVSNPHGLSYADKGWLKETDTLSLYELFKDGVERENLNIKNIDITFFTIVELVGSTCFSCIVNKIPCSIEEYKPYLYDLIRTLLHAA